MQVRVVNDSFINGAFPTPRKGEVRDIDPALAHHLVEAGVVDLVKVETAVEKKSLSASQAAPASQERTVTKPKGRPRKQSQSTTATD
jgi:hypothetical protein